jgi:glycosyltransferase involved in cell wall biosynthesis
MKGLSEAISLMSGVPAPFTFRVAGTVKESDYWAECLNLADTKLQRESFRYEGEFSPQDAQRIFAESALMVLPTKGENFGHAIAEALSVGCPVLIPDTTPWTPVVLAGGGALLRDEGNARRFVGEVLTESATARLARRTQALEAYREWFGLNQDVRTLFTE